VQKAVKKERMHVTPCTAYSHAGFVEVIIRELVRLLRLMDPDNAFWSVNVPAGIEYLNEKHCERFGMPPDEVLHADQRVVDLAFEEYCRRHTKPDDLDVTEYQPGTWVIILRPTRYKTECHWKGPYKVVRRGAHHNVYVLLDIVRGHEVTVHAKQMRHCDVGTATYDEIHSEAAHDVDFVVSAVLESVLQDGVESCLVKYDNRGYDQPEWTAAENVSHTDAYKKFKGILDQADE